MHHWVLEKDVSILHFSYFVVPFLSCLNLILAMLHVSRIPSLWQSLGIPTQFFHWILLDFLMAFFVGNLNIHRTLMLILLAARIGPSLLFMEWAFLWNFRPQQKDIAVYMIYFWTVQHTMKRICLNNLLWNMVRVALKNLPSALGSYNLISYFMHNNVILLSMLLFLHKFFYFLFFYIRGVQQPINLP